MTCRQGFGRLDAAGIAIARWLCFLAMHFFDDDFLLPMPPAERAFLDGEVTPPKVGRRDSHAGLTPCCRWPRDAFMLSSPVSHDAADEPAEAA